MKYLIGSKENFWKFIENINENDKVGILTHTDLDGVASAVMLTKILEKRKIQINKLLFLDLKLGMFDDFLAEAKEQGITKVFITDIKEDVDEKGFIKTKENFDVFLIDHHLVNENLLDNNRSLKTSSEDCAAQIIYDLLDENQKKDWRGLVIVAIIADYTFKKKENFDFLNEKHFVSEENVFDSIPGKLSIKINNAIIYFKTDLMKAYKILLEKDLDLIEEYSLEVNKEIEKNMKEYKENAEFYPEKELYFYQFKEKPKFRVLSVCTSLLSNSNKDATFISIEQMSDKPGFVKISARNQNGTRNMNELLRKSIEGFEMATAGGHPKASGGTFPKKYLKKFKQNILKI